MKKRESGIELLKIIAVFFIVVSHVVQTLITKGIFSNLGYTDGFIEVYPTLNLTIFMLVILRYIGVFGNLFFVIPSAWFLIDKGYNSNGKKVAKLWINTVVISIICLIVFEVLHISITKADFKKELFPNIYGNNWFITTYMIFLLIIPFLNKIIDSLDKKQLFRTCTFLFTMYFIISFIQKAFEANQIIYFITIYFVVAYLKKYLMKLCDNKKFNMILLIIGIITFIIFQITVCLLEMKFNYKDGNILFWDVNNNPILLVISIAIFNLFRTLKFKNSFINSISSLSLYIYLIHENLLVRNYIRARIWHKIYENFGYDKIFIEILVYSILLFAFAGICSFIYKNTIEKVMNFIVEKICNNSAILKRYQKIENKILEIK